MTLLQACLHYLRQAENLLQRVPADQYALPHTQCFGSSIGGHVRHCLDHYDRFLQGLADGKINYDHRHRNRAVEMEVVAALREITSLEGDLQKLQGCLDESQEVQVRLDCGGEDPHWTRSSMGRELQFLASHTVHHFAIIATMCHALQIPLDADFGLAPSTIKHQASA